MYVNNQKENEDINKLVDIIQKEGWVDDTTVLVTCSPENSSILSQILIHAFSTDPMMYQLHIESVEPGTNKVWNKETCEYEIFDKYIKNWMNDYVQKEIKFLFVNVKDDFQKILVNLRTKPEINYRIASLYYKDNKPDYTVEQYEGDLIFHWQKNKLWQHKHLEKKE